MKTKSILLISFLTLSSFYVASQKLQESRQTSYNTYIYKLTTKEAKKIYKKDIWVVDTSYFHTLVDSFPTDSQYTRKLPEGHYLKTLAEKNTQKFSITTVQNFDVFILNNNTDLCIQVYDLKGNIIKDADVRTGLKKLHFNKKIQAYIDRKSNQKGFLKVTHNGFTAYYDLNRQYNNSCVLRGTRKAVYGTPLKYAWVPVNYVLYIPVDAVKSALRGRPQGTIRRSIGFFEKSFEKLICLLDEYYCDYDYNNRFERKHTGYIVFNKPKYQPGDTVKFKAFLVTKKGKPVNKPVKIVLQTNRKNLELTELNPYRKGGYEYQFFLHDSLQLQLDRHYYLRLQLNDRKEYISGSFNYEDYELTKIKLTLEVPKTEHYRNTDFKLSVKGTDENELNLLDARLEVLVKPNNISEFFGNPIFIPDTLLFFERKLEPSDETELVISDSIFPKVNMDYDVFVRLLTSDNESVTENKKIKYFYSLEEFKTELLNDSIDFRFFKDGIEYPKSVIITASDNFNNKTEVFKGMTPCKVELNTYYYTYTIKSDSLTQSTDISSEPSLINCFSKRTKDSVFIVVDNPRKIPFIYNIYKKNTNKAEGYTDSLNVEQKSLSKQNYFVSLRYLWGGKVKTENYRIPLTDKNLTISLKQPKIVYPGQKSLIELQVTDPEGNPVEGVDVTAYSLTKKFNYTSPDLPYLVKNRKDKSVINNFHFQNFKPEEFYGLNLNYNTWKLVAGIDSLEYYKFIYPQNSIYTFRYYTPDSITQFAPFVVFDGGYVPIHVIYVDSKPVYFSWSTNTQRYSFKIDSGYHRIKLRTFNRNITIDSLYFKKGEKLIFSLNEDINHKNVTIEKATPELTTHEQRTLHKYIFPYRNTFGERYAYIEDGEHLQFLAPQQGNNRYNYNNFAGPVTGYVKFTLLDSFSTGFFHEPGFEYEFAPELLKMRSLDENKYPKYFSYTGFEKEKNLNDVVLTKKALYRNWKDLLESKRYLNARYRYPSSTSQGNGRLFIDYNNKKPVKDLPLNILLFRYDNHEFLRVYPGNTTMVHELKEGYHKIIFFYSGSKYHTEDSIYVRPNGLNYFQVELAKKLKKDNFSVDVSKLIEETIFKPAPYINDEEKELKQIYNSYQQQFQYTGEGEKVEGYVYDNETNEPLPGVNVIIKGTSYGTITDINGYYSLRVPANYTLIFSFIGYIQEEIPVDYNKVINVTLVADICKLEEVVVIGYGVQKKSTLTGVVASVISNSLLEGIPGVSGNISQTLQGVAAGVCITNNSPGSAVSITIRGQSTIEFDKTPLYIINGNVFTGDISELDPSLIQNIEILKDAPATAIYGARGANGVVIIEACGFKSTSSPANKGADYDETFFEAASQSSSIREIFSDYAFWQPRLTTDKNGKASFKVTFPDDVTSWETFYLAMNDKKQSGQTKSLIKSYKPLMAQLAVPRFLVQNDTAFAIGKVLNYSPDSTVVTTKFVVDEKTKFSKTHVCVNSVVDTLKITASDSLSIKYFLEKPDGYFDGEQRKISVFPIGLEEAKGTFYVLDRDTTIKPSFDPALGEATVYAKADIIEVMEDEINNLISYKYSCNEQIASKLKAFMAEKKIAAYKDEKFKYENEVEKLIRLIRKNQKDNGLWGWWKDSEESGWISLHVLEALTQTEKQGYATNINKNKITEKLIWQLENSTDFYTKVRILRILQLLKSQINYNAYINHLEKTKELSLNKLLHIIELKQLCNLKYSTDTLKYFNKTTLFGNIFFDDESIKTNLLDNNIQNTLMAYRILLADSTDQTETLLKIRNYFMENRKTGYWQNTFESAQIIEALLPDLLKNKSKMTKPVLTISGDINRTVSEFPFEMKINPDKEIQISKKGDFPVYLTGYQRYWNSNPSVNKNDFEIKTRFSNDSASILKAGQETTLLADVQIKKDAEYVMINIPIPGGCSYADKKNNFPKESHREYFKNETTIFCEYLSKGTYSFEIKLIPRYTGSYTLNPAKIELMYFPTFKGNNEIKRVRIN